jgi:hypothetical protein
MCWSVWSTLASIVVSATILTGCGARSEPGPAPEEPAPEEPAPEEPQPATVDQAAGRPEFLDFLAAATPAEKPLPPGQPLPEFAVEGWINGPPSKAAGSNGNILVIECWAYW